MMFKQQSTRLLTRLGTQASLAAALLAAQPGHAEEMTETPAQKDLPPIEFKGYWRMGYNTDINPLLSPLNEQGVNDVPFSRHVHNHSYFNLSLGKSFENGARINFDIDNDGKTPHRDNVWGPTRVKNYSDDPEENFQNVESEFKELYKRNLRVRELYLELPVGDAKIWAGARKLEFEDIRIFDQANPFSINALGLGATVGATQAHLSVQDQTVVLEDLSGRPSVPVKDISLLLRHELSLGEGRALKPMALIKQNGAAEKNDTTGTPEVKGSTDFKVGAIYSTWRGGDWGNLGLWFESEAKDKTGKDSGTNTSVGLMASHSYEFGNFGVLTGLYTKYTSFDDKRQEYKTADGNKQLIEDEGKTTNNVVDASVGVQPVYFATDHVHLALDMNYAFRSKKLSNKDSNALLVTPIVRYAMAKNTLGTPQIYTSFTYGLYDWKAKVDSQGKQTDSLLTTQTGFEVWF
jgi:hypothetical protein